MIPDRRYLHRFSRVSLHVIMGPSSWGICNPDANGNEWIAYENQRSRVRMIMPWMERRKATSEGTIPDRRYLDRFSRGSLYVIRGPL